MPWHSIHLQIQNARRDGCKICLAAFSSGLLIKYNYIYITVIYTHIYIYIYAYLYIYIYIVCVCCVDVSAECLFPLFLDLTAWNDCVMMWIPKTQSTRCTTCENWGQLWSTYHAVPILVEESWVQKSRSSDIKSFFSGETILVGGLEHGFYDFPYIGNNIPNWLIFFTGVETTNQISIEWFDPLRLSKGAPAFCLVTLPSHHEI